MHQLLLLILAFAQLTAVPICHAAVIKTQGDVNMTIEAPPGSRYIPNENLLCTPSTWKSVLLFFSANYFTHIATVRSIPGESMIKTAGALLMALIFPTSGMIRGLTAIIKCPIRCKTPLEKACKAGALCVVVRNSKWRPQDGDIVKDLQLATEKPPFGHHDGSEQTSQVELSEYTDLIQHFFTTSSPKPENAPVEANPDATQVGFRALQVNSTMNPASNPAEAVRATTPTSTIAEASHTRSEILNFRVVGDEEYLNEENSFMPVTHWYDLTSRIVHGNCNLPPGYSLAILPGDASTCQRVSASLGSSQGDIHHADAVAMSYSYAKSVFAVFQTVYAGFTLYESRGEQITRFGYAAFGLTVTPYLVMSIINLLGNILTPHFDAVYLMRDDVMDEAERRTGIKFDRVVGRMRGIQNPKSVNVVFRNGQSDGTSSDNDLMIIHKLQAEEHLCSSEENYDEKVARIDDSVAPLKIRSQAHRPTPTVRTNPQASPEDRLLNSSLGTADLEHERGVIVPVSNSIGMGGVVREWNLIFCGAIVVSAIPIAVMGIMTHFHEGESTHAQRVWIMTWLVFGIVFGDERFLVGAVVQDPTARWIYAPPAIGGFVVVAQMLVAYGSCRQLF
ncbi:uncharacterized protein PV07_05735 [Cladophialophora immunda]|uniref:Uncharacterized protein n=1 Tax=Cladophialophora immunda TaxID=569365 RepID=A0A0D1ZPP3_9EURO|nr:uncharacterized protein PV07_05735 [Cladophialophora immunda]KIW29951.1 hypothetical protein PV07_05735 [Cladophialophora immunda]OQV07271.1 hypothetical protein CLAIMM_11726 [Cladophialophora immunda]